MTGILVVLAVFIFGWIALFLYTDEAGLSTVFAGLLAGLTFSLGALAVTESASQVYIAPNGATCHREGTLYDPGFWIPWADESERYLEDAYVVCEKVGSDA